MATEADWELVGRYRVAFADLADSLDVEQLAASTLCGGWTPHMIAGHLVTFLEVPVPKFMAALARSRFDYDTAADAMARSLAERPIGELTAILRERATHKNRVSVIPPVMPMLDAIIHAQDVRRPLGLDGGPDPDHVAIGLRFLTTHRFAPQVVGKGVFDGLEMSATDTDWSWGDGAEVSGTAEALVMAMTGRPTFDELSGVGVEILAGRVG